MTINLKQIGRDEVADRHWHTLESALMAQAIASTSDVPPERRKSLLRS